MISFRETACHEQTMTQASPSEDQACSKPSPLLRLPLELRNPIYKFSLLASRASAAKSIYKYPLRTDWKDLPSPLLAVNGQVRDEVLDLVREWPITLRVTHQGASYDNIARISFIAQPKSKYCQQIPHLIVDIWPPHPDRPTDAIQIWRWLRKVRKDLLAAPQRQHLSLVFSDNEIATWAPNGKPRCALGGKHGNAFPPFPPSDWSDVSLIMDLFARVKATKASWRIPYGLACSAEKDLICETARMACDMMMGRVPFRENTYHEENEFQVGFQDGIGFATAFRLECEGAAIARNKLLAMAKSGDWWLKVGFKSIMEELSPNFLTLPPQHLAEMERLALVSGFHPCIFPLVSLRLGSPYTASTYCPCEVRSELASRYGDRNALARTWCCIGSQLLPHLYRSIMRVQ